MSIHVYPINDWIDHDTEHGTDCPCEPNIEFFDPETGESYIEPLIIHNQIKPEET